MQKRSKKTKNRKQKTENKKQNKERNNVIENLIDRCPRSLYILCLQENLLAPYVTKEVLSSWRLHRVSSSTILVGSISWSQDFCIDKAGPFGKGRDRFAQFCIVCMNEWLQSSPPPLNLVLTFNIQLSTSRQLAMYSDYINKLKICDSTNIRWPSWWETEPTSLRTWVETTLVVLFFVYQKKIVIPFI